MSRDAQAAPRSRAAARNARPRRPGRAVSVSELRAQARHTAVNRLAFGLALTADVTVGAGLLTFFLYFSAEPRPWLSAAAWVILLVSLALAQTSIIRPMRMGTSGFVALMIACAAVAALDLAGAWQAGPASPYPSATMALGGLLILITTRRSERTVLIVLAVLAAALLIGAGGYSGGPLAYTPRLTMMACALLPAIIAVTVVRAFRRIVHLQDDLAQVQSLTAASSARDTSTSAELAELDLEAERLLDDVAIGREPLPLAPETAQRAAELATQLRKRLVENRHLTWLYQAVRESSVLGPVTTVVDPEGQAATFTPEQRDGLLTALWLLADAERAQPALRVVVSREGGATALVTIDAEGLSPRRIDATTWQALDSVGRFSWSAEADTVRIAITVGTARSPRGR